MTTSSIAHIPMALGAGLAVIAGRGISWAIARIMAAPMASAVLFIASGLTLMAAANALFLQDGRHPAPLFTDVAMQTSATSAPPPVPPVTAQPPERPVELSAPEPQPMPETQPAPQSEPQPAEPSQAPSAEPSSGAIGNPEIAELQEKLREMGLFDGTVDGFYGPKTADAIRAFEARFDMPRTGAASSRVLEAVREAPINSSVRPQEQVQETPRYGGEIAALIESSEPEPAIAESEPVAVAEAGADALNGQTAMATATPETLPPAAETVPPARDRELVRAVQMGLSRLGFLHAPASGQVDETTAQAIRKFQIFHNYPATGEVTPQLLDRLAAAGADL